MFKSINILFCFLILGLIFTFTSYNVGYYKSAMNLIDVGPPINYQDTDGDDDDEDDKEDDDEYEDDDDPFILYSIFDLRDRETYVQVTNVGSSSQVIHVQIFNVNNDCNENDFYDVLTGNDTHVYNMKDIQTNDGNPSGVVLPANAYGAVIISTVTAAGGVIEIDQPIVGNVRLLDDSGYEYRTNIPGKTPAAGNLPPLSMQKVLTFNFNTKAGVTLSDVFGITTGNGFPGSSAVQMSDPTFNNNLVDIDVFNLDEVVFSCRDVLFACINQDSSRYQETLEEEGVSVASFEYGINNAIPHSKGGELLCPGNNISEGFVTLAEEERGGFFIGYIGLNNGNGRGTIDNFWFPNRFVDIPPLG